DDERVDCARADLDRSRCIEMCPVDRQRAADGSTRWAEVRDRDHGEAVRTLRFAAAHLDADWPVAGAVGHCGFKARVGVYPKGRGRTVERHAGGSAEVLAADRHGRTGSPDAWRHAADRAN